MCLRQSAFEQFFDVNGDESESGCFVFLSSDASALRGTDYFMTLQDTVPANVVGTIVDATVQDLENFSAAGHLKTHVLPLAIMGYGNSNLSAKVEALFHCVKLDVGTQPDRLQAYSKHVVGFCSDFGTESQLTDVPPMDIQKLLSSTWERSQLLSRPLQLQPETDSVDDVAIMPAEEEPKDSCKFDLSGAIFVPGLKHVLDNLTADLLRALTHFDSFQDGEPCLINVNMALVSL